MSLNQTPRSERVQIALFGKRNAGKSSLINAITNQNLAIVSSVKGTTTDPVYKSMELLPLGPVTMIDTPGLDDEGELGKLRMEKALQVLQKTDIALLVVDATQSLSELEQHLLSEFKERKLPYIIVINKTDLIQTTTLDSVVQEWKSEPYIVVSAQTKDGIENLKEHLATLVPNETERFLVADLLKPNDVVVLVVPIDASAPKGRLILPQQQMIRDILEAGAISIVTKETELLATLQSLKNQPKLVITDSQVFDVVNQQLPKEIPLTSFSILFARYKGDLPELVKGANAVKGLKDGDRILISEGCTHHRQCEDIGTVKIPNMLKKVTGRKLEIETSSGTEFPNNLNDFALVVHCGGCMLNQKEMQYRIRHVVKSGVPIVNYGVLIAALQGILPRTIELFEEEIKD